MTIWVDAQLSPRIAHWLTKHFSLTAKPLREIGLRDAEDYEIFTKARAENAVILTKDNDFLRLLEQHGSPPKVIWLTCGNTSDTALRKILEQHFATALELLNGGENLVEIGGI